MSEPYRVWADPSVVAHFQAMDVPYHDQQIEVLLRLLPLPRDQALRILDLGCGSGTLLDALLRVFPKATGVGADFSTPMLDLAGDRLGHAGQRVALTRVDFNEPTWAGALSGEFDAVVSRYAIHHVSDERKRGVYTGCYALLRKPGVFVNIEHVASHGPKGEALYDGLFVDTLFEAARRRGEAPDYGAVEAAYQRRPDKAANILAPTEPQLAWLRAAGFVDVDCYWKCFELAILAGWKV